MHAYPLGDSALPSSANAGKEPMATWLDCTQAQAEDTTKFAEQVLARTGLQLQALHIQDAANPLHPSHYDGMPDYDMVVFRGLQPLAKHVVSTHRKQRHQLQSIATQPITFFISNSVLITVRHGDAVPLLSCYERAQKNQGQQTPHQLMLRLINAQVDAYLALRQPLTDQLDRWQRELLDPRRAFNDWTALLDARLELRKLESLSEEQIDALQELREAWMEPNALPYKDAELDLLRVRLNDICEHIERVLNHAKRLESSVESAIQLHFAAVAHQTNQTVRNLTVLTAVFAPLTLLTGFYGMNVPLPWQQHAMAYIWILASMGVSALIVLGSVGILRFWRLKTR